MYGKGINIYLETLELGIKSKIIEKSGIWYSYNGKKIGQGKIQVTNFLKENSKIFTEINEKIREILIKKK
ncbi:hypothetical protein AOE58_00100 [Candidatus Riesia pthiripubis]|uniref:RecA-like C-terminal domain-containing protein n=1 Tax=Candidatus Riesia pthiripubis TaxID=428412 RepID=A0A1V0HP28_9ENTR|nr:hypothetical protein AOE58_00100 [Candidatus Riesia pthiripubis]